MSELTKKDVKKHIAAIHISNKISLLQRKTSNILLVNAYDDLMIKETHKISIDTLGKMVGFNSNNTFVLKTALKKLAETTIEWNILDENGEETWGISSILADTEIKKGICEYSYSPKLRKKLYNPEIFSRINISIQNNFESNYALALYENCSRFRRIGETGWIDLDLLRKLLGAESNHYNQFKELNRKIIKPAIKEINKISDIIIPEVKTRKEKRKIVAIKFIINEKKQLSLPMDIVGCVINKKLLERLTNYFGLKEKQALEIIATQDENYINENLDVVEERNEKGEIKKNLTAYTIKALDEDFRRKKTKKELEKENKLKKKDEIGKLESLIVKIENDISDQREEIFKAKKEQLSSEQLSSYKEEFKKNIEADEYSSYVKKNYQKNGLKGTGVVNTYKLFLKEKLLPKKLDDYRSYAESLGHDYDKLKKEYEKLKS